MPSVRDATPADFNAVRRLLEAQALPLDGVPASLAGFVVAVLDREIVGVAGLERHGDEALLRSVAVAPSARGHRLGAELVTRVLGRAWQDGAGAVWLLTTTAEAWFPRFGFTVAPRDTVPAALLASAEFQGACPATAVIMRSVR